jgi:hypothetical protein
MQPQPRPEYQAPLYRGARKLEDKVARGSKELLDYHQGRDPCLHEVADAEPRGARHPRELRGARSVCATLTGEILTLLGGETQAA